MKNMESHGTTLAIEWYDRGSLSKEEKRLDTRHDSYVLELLPTLFLPHRQTPKAAPPSKTSGSSGYFHSNLHVFRLFRKPTKVIHEVNKWELTRGKLAISQ